MGIPARRLVDAAAFAAVAAINTTRKNAVTSRQLGTSVAMTAGSVTITGVSIIVGMDEVWITRNTPGGTLGHLSVPDSTITASQFVINSSSGTETSTINWEIRKKRAHFDTTSTASNGGDFSAPTATALIHTAATAADLPTTITLAEQLRSFMLTHFADTLAHLVADATNIALITVATVPTATDQTTVNTLLNALKTAFNAHRSQSGVHQNNDGANNIAAANASNLGTSITLANAIFAAFDPHIQSAEGGPGISLFGP